MKQCKYLGVVTGKQHAEEYNKMSKEGLYPVASTILSIKATDAEESTALFHIWIYYDETANSKKPALEEQKTGNLKLEL